MRDDGGGIKCMQDSGGLLPARAGMASGPDYNKREHAVMRYE